MRPLKFESAAWTFRVQTKCRSTACFAPPHLSYRVYILYIIDIRARGALFLADACLSRFWRATHGFVFLVCRGSNSVDFASLVEVLAAHTAENELSQIYMCSN